MKKKFFYLSIAAVTAIVIFFIVFQLKGQTKNKIPDVTVIGRIKKADGIGRQPIELIKAISKDLSVGFEKTTYKDLTDVPPDIKKIVNKKKPIGPVIIFEDMLSHAKTSYYKKMFEFDENSHIRIAYSMMEGTRIPPSWVSILNTYFDAVAVPDPFLIEVYETSGVKIPVFNLPLTLDFSDFLNAPLKRGKKTPFVFANFSSCVDRKNHLVLVQAFARAFPNNKDVRLKINYRQGDDHTIVQVRKEIEKLSLTNVEFYSIEHTSNNYLKNFQDVDAYVSASKSEGFSIQPREAMALGIPVIATDNSAQSTICKSNLVRVIPSTIPEPALFSPTESIGNVFNCDVDEVAKAMQEIYSNYDFYLSRREQTREWTRKYDITSLSALYISLIKPQKLVLGEKNEITEDCLTTSSSELYQKYKRLLKL